MSLAKVATINAGRAESVSPAEVPAVMADIGRRARAAARILALAPSAQKDAALAAMAQAVRGSERRDILAANAEDVADAKAAARPRAFLDRLVARRRSASTAMATGLEVVAALPDPVGARHRRAGRGRTA